MSEPSKPQNFSDQNQQINSGITVPAFDFWNVFTQVINDTITETTTGLNNTVDTINSVSTQTSEAILKTVNDVNKTVNDINTMMQSVTPHVSKLQTKAQELGGGFAGAIAGETVGGVIGGIAGTAVLGPVGTVFGSQMGSFIGFIVGAQIGEEAIVQRNQVAETQQSTLPTAEKPIPFEERLQRSLQIRGGDRIGDTVGAITGGIVGSAVLGPPGALIGSSLGGAFVGRLGEDAVINLGNLGNQQNFPKTQPVNIKQDVTTWFGSATNEFVGETMVMTVGSIVGGMVLGIRGQRLGREFGHFVGKKIDWNFNPIATLLGQKPEFGNQESES